MPAKKFIGHVTEHCAERFVHISEVPLPVKDAESVVHGFNEQAVTLLAFTHNTFGLPDTGYICYDVCKEERLSVCLTKKKHCLYGLFLFIQPVQQFQFINPLALFKYNRHYVFFNPLTHTI